VSQHFELPFGSGNTAYLGAWRSSGRGVPDVAGPADPHRGCAIIVVESVARRQALARWPIMGGARCVYQYKIGCALRIRHADSV